MRDGSSRRFDARAVAPVALVLGHLLSRALALGAAGLEFDTSPLPWAWQYLDIDVLQHDLWRGLYYLHAQPPLFNLFLGLGLAWGGESADAWFQVAYLAMGVALVLALYGLLRRLCVPAWPAAVATLVFTASPSAILYENFLFYTLPVTLLLCVAAVAFYDVVARQRLRDAIVLFGVLAVLVLSRTVFHLTWLIAIAAGVVALVPGARRRVALGALVPILLATALYAKNAKEFGSFANSSWLGMNVAKLTTVTVPRAEREQLVREGRVSPLAVIPPFSPLPLYPAYLRNVPAPDTRALDRPFRSTGPPNYNHIAYVGISRIYLQDAAFLLREFPGNFATRVASAWLLFLAPPSHSRFLGDNRARLRALERVYDAVLFGVPNAWRAPRPDLHPASFEHLRGEVGWFWAAVALAATGYGLAAGVGARRAAGRERARRLTLLFLVANILWVAGLVNLVEVGENNRFRMGLDPLILALAASGLAQWARRARAS